MAKPLSSAERWTLGGGVLVLGAIALPLWGEFREPGRLAWNVLLAAMLIALAVAAFCLQRYVVRHIGEIGEARFDTSNRERDNG